MIMAGSIPAHRANIMRMPKMYTKKVAYLIDVPVDKYCWGPHTCCQFFDNEGGHAHCALNLWGQKTERKTGYVLKPKKCAELKSI
jgi:hypothetical protein